MKRILVAGLAGLVVAVGLAAAHEGHEHKAMGTVAVVDATHIEVTGKDGKTTSIRLTPETKYSNGKVAAASSDIKVGQRVVVVYVENEKEKMNVGKQVLLGVTEKDATPAKPHEHD